MENKKQCHVFLPDNFKKKYFPDFKKVAKAKSLTIFQNNIVLANNSILAMSRRVEICADVKTDNPILPILISLVSFESLLFMNNTELIVDFETNTIKAVTEGGVVEDTFTVIEGSLERSLSFFNDPDWKPVPDNNGVGFKRLLKSFGMKVKFNKLHAFVLFDKEGTVLVTNKFAYYIPSMMNDVGFLKAKDIMPFKARTFSSWKTDEERIGLCDDLVLLAFARAETSTPVQSSEWVLNFVTGSHTEAQWNLEKPDLERVKSLFELATKGDNLITFFGAGSLFLTVEGFDLIAGIPSECRDNISIAMDGGIVYYGFAQFSEIKVMKDNKFVKFVSLKNKDILVCPYEFGSSFSPNPAVK